VPLELIREVIREVKEGKKIIEDITEMVKDIS